jgi:chemotaxis receptor (MCP) glutamine deamidase CheD
MGFKLQVGDVVQVKNRKGDKVVTALLGSCVEVASMKGRPAYWVLNERMVIHSTKTVHRPTPEGMKQVWPEVEGK